jgi:GNAT superfamily N-acetyltransferase
MDGELKNPGIQIRMAVAEDASRVASVLRESFEEYESFYTSEAFAATTPTGDQVVSRMSEGPVWVALHDRTIVGTAAAVSRGEALYIRGMAILPAARGQRIGELLLRRIENFASAQGYYRLVLSTTPFLTRAIRLYEGFGFQLSPEGPHELFGTALLTMVKNLEVLNEKQSAL